MASEPQGQSGPYSNQTDTPSTPPPATGGTPPPAPGPDGGTEPGPAPGAGRTEPAPPAAQLRRSRNDRIIAGVNGGLGQFFGVDPLWFRIATVILALSSGVGVLLYLAAWLLIPEDDGTPTPPRTGQPPDQGPVIAGLVLMSIGLVLLLNLLIPWFARVTWPLLLIAAGAVLIYVGRRR